MVLAADNQHVIGSCLVIPDTLQSHVVIWVGRVPVKRSGDGAAGDARADDIGQIGSLLGVNGEKVVNRSVGCHDQGRSSDERPTACFNARWRAALDYGCVRSRKDTSA